MRSTIVSCATGILIVAIAVSIGLTISQLLYYWIGGVMPEIWRGNWMLGGDYRGGTGVIVIGFSLLPFFIEAFIFVGIVQACQGVDFGPKYQPNHRPNQLRVVVGGLFGVGLFFGAKALVYIALSAIGVVSWYYPMGIGKLVSGNVFFGILYFGIFGTFSLMALCSQRGVLAVAELIDAMMSQNSQQRH